MLRTSGLRPCGLTTCSRDKEVRALAERGQWPQAAPPELLAHAGGCRACAEVALVAQVFRKARADARGPQAHISAGTIWWRAQLYRRNQAIQQLDRPILAAHIFALTLTLVLAAGFLIDQTQQGINWFSRIETFTRESLSLKILRDAAVSGTVAAWLLVSVTLTGILLCAAAVYLAFDKD